jgi:predicted esterase
MRKFKLTVFCNMILLSVATFEVSAQQVFKTTANSVIGFLEYVPQNYNTNSDKYPVVIFLHGVGERCPNTLDTVVLSQHIQNVAKHGPPKYVKSGSQFPFILISPQLKNNYGNWPPEYVMEVINYCKTYLRIDERRIYLTGLSLGGGGTWWTAQDYPEFFAAIAPVCGSRNSTAKAPLLASENLPVWAFHGDIDTVVPLSRSQNMINAINTCTPIPSPLAKLTIYTGIAHSAWNYAYRNDNTLHTPNVYDWMMSHTNTYNKNNRIPIANAGPDKTISTSNTTITGSGTDADGTLASYAWTKLSGPSAELNNISSPTLGVTNLVAGEYLFRLIVTDNSGNTDSDYVKINVGTADKNILPVANAGLDKIVKLPTTSTAVTGAGSDADGTIASYEWTKISGSACTMSGTTTSLLKLSNLTSGSYTFRLTVKDDKGGSDGDDVIVKVDAPPVVNAGPDITVTLPIINSVLLKGSATDADDTVTQYKWSKHSGPNVVANAATATSPTFELTKVYEGIYVFKLVATDNLGIQAFDYVTVTVNAEPTPTAARATVGKVETVLSSTTIDK